MYIFSTILNKSFLFPQNSLLYLCLRFGYRYEVFDDEKRNLAKISSVNFCCGLPGGSGFEVSFSIINTQS